MMQIISWLVFGLIVGSIANVLDPRPSKGGLLGSIVLGIVGSLVGGYLGNLILGGTPTGFIPSLLLSVGGAMILLFVGRALTRA